jgi:hypothetical protein
MRIRLEYDDRPLFTTLTGPLGQHRVLLIRVNGKRFTVWRMLRGDEFLFARDDKLYLEEVDKALIASMEKLFEKMFLDACAAIPEGTDLLTEGEP